MKKTTFDKSENMSVAMETAAILKNNNDFQIATPSLFTDQFA